jgi:hypothetical protein
VRSVLFRLDDLPPLSSLRTALGLLFFIAASIWVSAQVSAVPPEFIQATQAMREGKLDEAANMMTLLPVSGRH